MVRFYISIEIHPYVFYVFWCYFKRYLKFQLFFADIIEWPFLYVCLISYSIAQFAYWFWWVLFGLLDSLGFSTYTIMQCVNKDIFSSSFLIFMSFSFSFIVVFRTFCKMFNRNSNLWAKLFVTRYNVSCRYFVGALYLVFWEFLSWTHLDFSPKAFSASVEMIVWFFSFDLLLWQIALILQMLNQYCILESNFILLLALIFSILLRI